MPASKAPKRNRTKPDDPAFEKVRAKIQASQIVNALNNHVVGKNKMESTQITAALGLLKKVLPDLQVTELTGKDGGPLIPIVNIYGNSDKPK